MKEKGTKISCLMLVVMTAMAVFSAVAPSASALVEEGVYTNPVPPGCAMIDFEEGTDGAIILSTIPGLQFTTTLGYDWVYGDVRTGQYNARSLTDPSVNFGPYVVNGYFFAWLGPYMGQGRIDFTLGTASYFSVLTSTSSGVILDAYDSEDNLIATSGWASGNLYTYTFTRLTVEAEGMAYIIVHDTGNYWEIDDLVTDAPGVGRIMDKTLSTGEGYLGDVVHVTLELNVRTGETAIVVDTLPSEWSYIEGSFTVNGVPATPTITKIGPPLPVYHKIFYTITASGTFVIEFDCKVDTAYWEDREVCNVATATWFDEESQEIETKEDVECFIIHPFDHLVKDICHEDWPMFHHDLALSGVSTSSAPNTNATLWTFDTGSSISSSPAIVDGRLYIGAYDRKLYAIDANTGALLWTYQTGGAIYSSPAVAYGKVYILSTDGNVYALNAISGALVWSRKIGPGSWDWSSPAVHSGRVFIATSTGWVYCLGAATGAVIWSTYIGGEPNSPITVVNGKVYSGTHNFGAGAPTLAALDELTGAIIWTYNYHLWHGGVIGFINANGVAVVDGDGDGDLEVYFGVVTWTGFGPPQAICLDEATGNEVWSQNINGWSTSTPAVHNGMVFIGSDDHNVYALNAGTGAYVWTFPTGAMVWSAPAVADGKVFVASLDHIFYAIDEATGNLIWSYDTSVSRMEGSPAVACGKVFVGNENGKVYAWGSPSPGLTIKEKTEVQWTIEIEVTNPFSYTMKNAIIEDRLGAELEIDGVISPGDVDENAKVDIVDLVSVALSWGSYEGHSNWNHLADLNYDGFIDIEDLSTVGRNYGSLFTWTTGESDKIHMTWYIGNLDPGETARLKLLISTDINPAGHQEYSEPGVYELNSGATLKFIDPEQNMQLSACTDSIYVTVLPAEDP